MSKTYRLNLKAVRVTAEVMHVAPRPGDERGECIMIRNADGSLRPYEPPAFGETVEFVELSEPREGDRVLH